MNPDELDQEGFAALHHAVKKGSPERVQTLIDVGADVNVTTSVAHKALTPLMIAVLNGEAKCLGPLLRNHANVQKRNTDDKTALILCIELNKLDCLRVLLAGERDLLGPDFSGKDPIEHALVNNRPECLELILQAHKETRDCVRLRHENLFYAALKGYEKCVEILLNEFVSLPEVLEGPTALHAAASSGNLQCLNIILQHCKPTDIDARDDWNATPLWYASRHGHANCMSKLLEAGAEPFVFANDPYLMEYQITDEEHRVQMSSLQATLFHTHYCDNCRQEDSCICYDVFDTCQVTGGQHCLRCEECDNKENCNCETERCFQMLINRAEDALVNASTEEAKTAALKFLSSGIEACIIKNDAEKLKTLLIVGADPCMPVALNPAFDTVPLYLAVNQKSLACLQILLGYGKTFLLDKLPLDPQQQCANYFESNLDALHVLFGAVQEDWHDGINYLLDTGMDVNTVSYYGNAERETPIVFAMIYSSIATIKLLLKRGASSCFYQDAKWRLFRNFMCHSTTVEVTLNIAKLFLAAGFPKDKILRCFIERDANWKQHSTDEQYKRIKDFVHINSKDLTLQAHCRDMIGKHLMSINRQTNLFHLVPRLPITTTGKEFLLYDIELNV